MAPTPLKTSHLTEELRIQEPEFRRRRRYAPCQILTSGFLDSRKFTVR
jgi:hypothetical protein